MIEPDSLPTASSGRGEFPPWFRAGEGTELRTQYTALARNFLASVADAEDNQSRR